MNAAELLKKYESLLAGNKALQEENESLKAQLGIIEQPQPSSSKYPAENPLLDFAEPKRPIIRHQADASEKIRLFMSLFKGRNDVYAKRWHSKDNRTGYAPVSLNEKKGRKKKQNLIGQIGAGQARPSRIIDVAIMPSLSRKEDVREMIKPYGMVIVDECHHVQAFSFEQILKSVHVKHVYGLTATPTRQDGHHPIIFMHCGPIRYGVNARKQAEKRPFDHYVIPRLSGFRALLEEF